MIDRIQLIRNIGQFDSVSARGQIPLKKLTLVYAENGRGKTTVAAVLRSLGRDRDEARRSDGERLRRAGEHLATGLKPAVVRIARRRPTAVELPPGCLGGPYRRAVLGARELSAFAGVLTDNFSFGSK
jgi:hypothetical protein